MKIPCVYTRTPNETALATRKKMALCISSLVECFNSMSTIALPDATVTAAMAAAPPPTSTTTPVTPSCGGGGGGGPSSPAHSVDARRTEITQRNKFVCTHRGTPCAHLRAPVEFWGDGTVGFCATCHNHPTAVPAKNVRGRGLYKCPLGHHFTKEDVGFNTAATCTVTTCTAPNVPAPTFVVDPQRPTLTRAWFAKNSASITREWTQHNQFVCPRDGHVFWGVNSLGSCNECSTVCSPTQRDSVVGTGFFVCITCHNHWTVGNTRFVDTSRCAQCTTDTQGVHPAFIGDARATRYWRLRNTFMRKDD